MSAPKSTPLYNLVVLVVDDEADSREILSILLAEYGAVALTARSAEQAVAMLETARCDVIVTDLTLPDHDGHWLLEQVHRRPTPEPVIAFTGHPAPASVAGFAAWLLKPVTPDVLVAAIAEAVAA